MTERKVAVQVIQIFRPLQLAVILGFAMLISDFRRRDGAAPLLPTAAVVVLKLLYPIPFLAYLFVVTQLRAVAGRDVLAMALTAGATILVVRARRDIGQAYTWTGFRRIRPVLVTRGCTREFGTRLSGPLVVHGRGVHHCLRPCVAGALTSSSSCRWRTWPFITIAAVGNARPCA